MTIWAILSISSSVQMKAYIVKNMGGQFESLKRQGDKRNATRRCQHHDLSLLSIGRSWKSEGHQTELETVLVDSSGESRRERRRSVVLDGPEQAVTSDVGNELRDGRRRVEESFAAGEDR